MNNIEELRKIAQEEMEKQIKENINSSLIFKYVNDLEKENKTLKEKNKKAKEYIQNIRQYFSEDCQADFVNVIELLKEEKCQL